MMNRLPMHLTPAADYFARLVADIPKAKKRIVINAMTLLWGNRTELIVPLLIKAAQQGVEVRIVGDIYSKFAARMTRFWRPQLASWEHTQALNEQLRAAGVHITYVGKLGANPFKRRCHTKITLIDDDIFSFGGVNFSDDSFQNHDYMLQSRDSQLANRLDTLIRDIEHDATTPLPDQRAEIDLCTSLLFDGGTSGESVIYETACDTVAAARKVYYISQMCPSGRLAELITQTDNECYFVRPAQAEPWTRVDLIWSKMRYRITNRYKGKTYIHAKFILTEDHDGSKHVITGSNNFSWRGVRYGTKEIALHSTDTELWNALYIFLQEKIVTRVTR